MGSGMPLNDLINQHFSIPSPGAVNDKIRAFFDKWFFGDGSPEGVITAPEGSIYICNDGTTAIIYQKQSGSGNTGWVAISTFSQQGAYTQTYATASKTVPNNTAVAVATTGATAITPFGYTTAAQADAIVAGINALIVDVENTKKVVNALIDDLQALGLVG